MFGSFKIWSGCTVMGFFILFLFFALGAEDDKSRGMWIFLSFDAWSLPVNTSYHDTRTCHSFRAFSAVVMVCTKHVHMSYIISMCIYKCCSIYTSTKSKVAAALVHASLCVLVVDPRFRCARSGVLRVPGRHSSSMKIPLAEVNRVQN